MGIKKALRRALLIYLPAILLLIFGKRFIDKYIYNAHAFANPQGEGNNPNDRKGGRNAVILVQIKNRRSCTGKNDQNQGRECRDRFHKL